MVSVFLGCTSGSGVEMARWGVHNFRVLRNDMFSGFA